MLIAYIDETGDVGDPALGGSSSCFGLGCVIVDSKKWSQSFEAVLGYRRAMRRDFGVLMRSELKANYLIRGSGDLRKLNLSTSQRSLIYRYGLNVLEAAEARAFAVVVDKVQTRETGDRCLAMAWETLLQRLERTTYYERDELMIVHDNGDNLAVRKIARRARRHLTAGSAYQHGRLNNPFARLVEDPSPRQSHESYFLQLADLVAYAGWRTHIPPGRGAAKVVPQSTWAHLGAAVHAKVNGVRKVGEPGVVIRK